MKNKIYQVQIALKGSKPKIWRRLLIESDLRLSDFHIIIQVAMGWTNSHFHQFVKNGINFRVKYPDDDFWDEHEDVDYKKTKVSALLKKEKDKLVYEYDFGDSWDHDIILEKILPKDDNAFYPICLAGKMKCPPEDCGGISGFEDMLEILKDPSHEEYEEYIVWTGGGFDPKEFDKEALNETLKKENYGLEESDY